MKTPTVPPKRPGRPIGSTVANGAKPPVRRPSVKTGTSSGNTVVVNVTTSAKSSTKSSNVNKNSNTNKNVNTNSNVNNNSNSSIHATVIENKNSKPNWLRRTVNAVKDKTTRAKSKAENASKAFIDQLSKDVVNLKNMLSAEKDPNKINELSSKLDEAEKKLLDAQSNHYNTFLNSEHHMKYMTAATIAGSGLAYMKSRDDADRNQREREDKRNYNLQKESNDSFNNMMKSVFEVGGE